MLSFEKENCTGCPLDTEYFNFLTTKEKKNLKSSCIKIEFKKKENIFKQNLSVNYAFYMREGLVMDIIEGEHKNFILNILSGPSFLGMSSFFMNSYTFSCRVLENASVCMFPINIFQEVLYSNKKFLKIILKSLNERFNEMNRRLMICNNMALKEKLAYYLLWFSDKIYKSKNFKLSLSREELALLLGASRENVVRTISEFKESGLIETSGKRTKILNKAKLYKLANFKLK